MTASAGCQGSSGWAVRVLAIVLPVLALATIVALLAGYFRHGLIPGDAFTYLAAGERLNVGHLLYALSPGDRPVGLKPPYWTVPLLSPPFIAVLFRPFALLGDAGAYAWWGLTITTIAVTVFALLRQSPITASLALLALSIPLVYEIAVGNVNGLILGGSVLAWVLSRDRRETLLGANVAFIAALKLTPLALGVWVVARGRRASIVSLTLTCILLAAVSVVGAGFSTHVEYFTVMRTTLSTGTSEMSLGGLGRAIGLDATLASILPVAAVAIGCIATVLLRRRPALSYGAAVITMVLGSPVVNINTPVLLLALLAPVAFPLVPELSPVATCALRDEAPAARSGTAVGR